MKFTRDQIWRHNGFSGSVRMAYLAMLTISRTETASDESQKLAWEAKEILEKLTVSLKKRRDQV